jgi:hypothetical protein
VIDLLQNAMTDSRYRDEFFAWVLATGCTSSERFGSRG